MYELHLLTGLGTIASLAALSLLLLAGVMVGVVPALRFQVVEREEPRWGGVDVIQALILSLLVSLGAAYIFLQGLEGLSPSEQMQRKFLAQFVSAFLISTFCLQYVRGVLQQPLSALGWVRSPIRNAAPTLLLCIFSYLPLIFVTGLTQLIQRYASDGAGDLQRAVEDFQKLIASREYGAIILFFIGASIVAPISEEILFRGFFFGSLRAKWGALPAALISTSVFALVHDAAQISILCVGLLICFVYEKTGSLVYCIVFHSLFNTMQLALLVLSGL